MLFGEAGSSGVHDVYRVYFHSFRSAPLRVAGPSGPATHQQPMTRFLILGPPIREIFEPRRGWELSGTTPCGHTYRFIVDVTPEHLAFVTLAEPGSPLVRAYRLDDVEHLYFAREACEAAIREATASRRPPRAVRLGCLEGAPSD